MMKVLASAIVLMLLFGSSVSASQDAEQTSHGNLEIRVASVFVDDQDKALKFYTEILGFKVNDDIPVGEYKWLTVVSPDNPDGTELLLEPNANPAAKTYQKAIYDQGIPATALFVDDIQAAFERLKNLGVKFTTEPTEAGAVTIAIFDDTCGNLIQIVME